MRRAVLAVGMMGLALVVLQAAMQQRVSEALLLWVVGLCVFGFRDQAG